jgi:hypothetical protein
MLQAWLDAERVLVATKCNQLLEVDMRTGHKAHIQLPPEPPVRTHDTVDSGGCSALAPVHAAVRCTRANAWLAAGCLRPASLGNASLCLLLAAGLLAPPCAAACYFQRAV